MNSAIAGEESGQLALRDSSVAAGNLSLRSVEDILAHAEGVPLEKRYQAICDALEHMTNLHENIGAGIEKVFNYIQDNQLYIGHATEAEFQQEWTNIQDVIKLNTQNRNRRRELINYISDRWLDEESREWLAQPDHSVSLLRTVQKLSRTIKFRAAVERVNKAAIRRIGMPRRGVSNAKQDVTGDWVAALKDPEDSAPLSNSELQDAGMGIGRFGLVCPISEALQVQGDDVGCDPPHDAEGDFPTPGQEISLANQGPYTSSAPSSAPSSELSDLDSANFGYIDEELDKTQRSVTGSDHADVDARDSDLSEEAEGSDWLDETGTESIQKCKCSSDINKSWQGRVLARKVIYTHEALTLLEKWTHFRLVCYTHNLGLGGCLGLNINNLKAPELRQRLQEVHDRRLEIGQLKTDPATFNWFRRSHRPARPSDSLGPYKLRPQPGPAFDYDQSALLSGMADKGIWERWVKDGTVNTDMFSWWFETPIGEIVLSEFDMYHFHLRSINGRSNWGWLRNMFHSIGQQLMRQDPAYYVLYAALRPDKHWRLVSYPYYAKFAKTGDSTYFRHIDLNIPDLLAKGRGSSQIQGTVSLDNETEDNCTILLPGMHRKLAEWWKLCLGRGAKPDTFVHRLTEQMYTRKDAAEFGIHWTSVPCRRGEARVTLPHIPHGALGPATGTRRTMLPWFVGLQDDLSTLEVAEAGTWSQLRDAHMSLGAGPASPSGLANRYGVILFRFPAAVEIGTLGAVSDALVCRLPWNSPRVEKDRDILLGADRAAAHAYIRDWRVRAVQTAQETMQLVRQREMDAFGRKSYFYNRERLQLYGIPLPELADDEDGENADDGEDTDGGEDSGGGKLAEGDSGVELEFAEQGENL